MLLRWAARIVIGTGAVLVAVASWVAAQEAARANGSWQEGVRAQVRYTGRTLENVRAVYLDEAPQALQVWTAVIRAEELSRRAARGGRVVRAEAAAERATAREYLENYGYTIPPVNPLLTDPRYGGHTAPRVGRRLADLQAGNLGAAKATAGAFAAGDRSGRVVGPAGQTMIGGAVLVLLGVLLAQKAATGNGAVSPEAPWEPGTGPYGSHEVRRPGGRRAAGLVLAVVLVATSAGRRTWRVPPVPAFLLTVGGLAAGFLLRGRPGLRTGAAPRPGENGGNAEQAVVPAVPPGVPPAAPEEKAGRWWVPPWAVLLGVLVTVATALQIQAGTGESRALGVAARDASLLSTAAIGHVTRKAFETNGTQIALMTGHRGDALSRAARRAGPATRTAARARAAADRATARRIGLLTVAMSARPADRDGMDATTRLVVGGIGPEQQAVQREHDSAVLRAEAAGTRSDRLVVVILLLSLAGICAEIARASWARRLRRPLGLAGGTLGTAAAVLAVLAFT
ncbi:hypothetical protein ABGB17_31125 [Sphaerisporangium sp. B11E5]|uniref:hypothetical protein n=1 Tax=Sphaerisporangium sp. B11E5 TaxID=3153563 RepID=UPI00325D755C